jgi:hypothetical protein
MFLERRGWRFRQTHPIMQNIEDSANLRIVVRSGGIYDRERDEIVQRPFHRLVVYGF